MLDERTVSIPVGGLHVDARLHRGDPLKVAWVVLHPHPQYGGDMDNHVVMALCEALARRGSTTLRFNFRGTGRSEGAFDDGRGERLDAMAAVESLRALGADRIGLAGYSFGAAIATSVAEEAGVMALVMVSPPAMGGALHVPVGIPVLAITGDRDPVSPSGAVMALAGPSLTAVVVPGVDHGWWPGVEALCEHLAIFGPE